jgi:hypothetical protein
VIDAEEEGGLPRPFSNFSVWRGDFIRRQESKGPEKGRLEPVVGGKKNSNTEDVLTDAVLRAYGMR